MAQPTVNGSFNGRWEERFGTELIQALPIFNLLLISFECHIFFLIQSAECVENELSYDDNRQLS